MEEVQYLCRRVAIMDHGRVIAQGPIDQVRALAGDSVVLRIPVTDAENGTLDAERIRTSVGVPLEVRMGELRFILPHGSSQVPQILNSLLEIGVSLEGMTVESPNLETVFLSLTGKALRDTAHEGATAQ